MTISDSITIEHALEVLNRMYRADPKATAHLIRSRVVCNRTLAEDPTIQVGGPSLVDPRHPNSSGGVYSVGILGVLNGLFGIDEDGSAGIAATYSDDKEFLGFTRLIRGELADEDGPVLR